MTPRNGYGIYQRAKENNSEIEQLLMLYDGAITFLRQAIQAIKEENYQERWNLINRVCAIVSGLAECLDFEEGKETATALQEFYSSIDARLISVHHNNRIDICETVIGELVGMRDAWRDVAKQMKEIEKSSEAVIEGKASLLISDENADSGTSSTHITA